MAGKAKYAEKLADHLSAPVDAACAISRPGTTATASIGGLVGAAASVAVSHRGGDNDIKITGGAWVAVQPDRFSLVKGDNVWGRPKGEPIAQIPYHDVAALALKRGRLTMRADVALTDGRTFAFEAKHRGANKPNAEVLELLASRCA
jgi:hypothetical protein